jgi:DegV family protein with EDD domain
MIVGEQEFVDTESLDTAKFVHAVNEFKGVSKSACPSPEAFYEVMQKGDNIIVVTLSGKLSGTNASAMAAGERLKTEHPNKKLFILDSLCASSGIDLILYKIRDLVEEGKNSFDEIAVKAEEIRNKMHTRFLLQDLGNLVKNGRMSKMVGKILTTAKIKLICGDDGEGEIKKYGMAIGTRRGLATLAELPSKEITAEDPIMITHVHDAEGAAFLENQLKTKFGFKNIKVRLMRGLSSLYSADKGIVIAY